ncbi:hypothetical protein Aduo_008587 [Ancylostoma duodenale]
MFWAYLLAFAVAPAVPLTRAPLQIVEELKENCHEYKMGMSRRSALVNEINARRTSMVNGKQRNGRYTLLPIGENVLEMKWSCRLEWLALEALNRTKDKCPTEWPEAPNGTTGFFDYRDHVEEGDIGLNIMKQWLSEIDKTKMPLNEHWKSPVWYRGVNRNYSNLVRYDSPRIGCAELECKGKHAMFCLTDKPPLEKDKDIVYYYGNGACPIGECRAPTNGCSKKTGLCFSPSLATTPTPPCANRRYFGFQDLFATHGCWLDQ